MCRKTWFFKGLLGVNLAFGLLLLSGCDLFNNDKGEEKTTYTVSFSPGDGSGTAPETKTVEAGAVIILPNQGGMSPLEGKIFGGWKTEAGTSYQAGAGFTVNGNAVFTAVWNSENDDNNLYQGFYKYPIGRADDQGLLKISNSINSSTLLFNGTLEKENYIGTVGPLSSVQVKLPEEKFYTILAVDKENYEERKNQAAQFNVLTYYSNTQAYAVTVSPSNTYGSGTWVFNNKTSFWVQIKKSDMSQNYAVIAPNAERVSIPINLNTPYDYYVYFSKELKYNGKTVALVETTDRSQANTAKVDDKNTVYSTTIYATTVPTNNIKPAVMVKNNSSKSVRVYYVNQQKTNGGAGADDFVIAGGETQLVSGFEIADNTNNINFYALAWELNKYVPVDMPMEANMIYEITIPNTEDASAITVTEVEASKYYN